MAYFHLSADAYSDEMMRMITRENGLPGETVSQITAGRNGTIWIATSSGVCCYNGRELTNFVMPHSGKEQNYTYDLAFSADNTLYAATAEGVFMLDIEKERFVQIFFQKVL